MADRNKQGQFIKGHKSIAGKSTGRKPNRYRELFQSVVTYSEWKLILIEAKEQAKEGDDKARKFLSDYLAGSPQQFLDITTNGENINNSPLEGMTDDQRADYFSKLAIALSTNEASTNLENTE